MATVMAQMKERLEQLEQQDRSLRQAFIAEFGGDRSSGHRHALARLTDAVAFAKAGAPFGIIPPGHGWKPGVQEFGQRPT